MSDDQPYTAESKRVRVALSTFPPLLQHGLEAILAEHADISIIARGCGIRALRNLAANNLIDVAVVHECDVSAAAIPSELLTLRAQSLKVLVLAERPSQSMGLSLLAEGASCLALSSSPPTLVDAVHATAEGRALFVHAENHRIVQPPTPRGPALTRRELEVFPLLSEAMSYAQAALVLGISPHTVKSHATHIMKKLGVRSKRDLHGMRLAPNV